MFLCLGGVGEEVLDAPKLVFGEGEGFAVLPTGVVWHEVDMGVGNVGADDFHEGAGAEFFFHVPSEFLDGLHKGLVVCVVEVVDFVDF